MIRNENKSVLFVVAFTLITAWMLQPGSVVASEVSGSLCTGVNCPVEGIAIVAPTASPVAGTYTSTQSVTLSAAGSNSIHYTTNGTTPTCTSGTTYSSAISVTSSQTVKAIACYANSNTSSVASFGYTITISSGGSGGGGGGGYTPPPAVATSTPATTATTTTATPIQTPAPTQPTIAAQLLSSLITQLLTLIQKAQAMGISVNVPPEILNTPVTSTVPPPSVYTFTRDLSLGTVGDDVVQLQKYLNTHGFVIAQSGPGSVGNETTKFGSLTQAALVRFQQAKGISPASGYFGAITRAYVNAH